MATNLDDQLVSYFAWIEQEVGLPMHSTVGSPTSGPREEPRQHDARVLVVATETMYGGRRPWWAFAATVLLVAGLIAGIALVRANDDTTAFVGTSSSVATTPPSDVPPAESTVPSTATSLDIANTLAPGATELLPASPLAGRIDPMVVWSGSRMIVWGGSAPKPTGGEIPFDDGAAYDPVTREWTALPAAPISARSNAASVWTGTEMIIWGGSDNGTSLFDGAAYNPATNSWRLLPPFDELTATVRPTTIWTGTEMIVLEGINGSRRGGAFNPETNTWRMIAPPPGRGVGPHPQAVWTGTEVVVTLGSGIDDAPVIAAYSPTTDGWDELAGDMDSGQRPRLLWTGSEVLAFAMTDTSGGAWNSVTRTWRDITIPPAGSAINAEPVWTGELAVFWNGGPVITTYDPDTDTWADSSGGELVRQRLDGVRVWAGGILIAWGGFLSNPDGTASGADDGIAWRPDVKSSQSTSEVDAQSRTIASELGVVTYQVPVGTVNEVRAAPTLPDYVVGYDQWIVTDCCQLKVTLESLQPPMLDDELVDTFTTNGLTWKVYDTGPRDGTQIIAITTSGPLSVLVGVQKGFSDQPINSSATEVATSVAQTVVMTV